LTGGEQVLSLKVLFLKVLSLRRRLRKVVLVSWCQNRNRNRS
jgi:hypothetical protein